MTTTTVPFDTGKEVDVDKTLYDTLTYVCAYLDGDISHDRLHDWMIQAWADCDRWPSTVIDAFRWLGMQLSGAELRARLTHLVNGVGSFVAI